MLKGQKLSGRVEADPNRVEPDLARPPALEPATGKPLARHRPDLPLLAHADRGERPEHVHGGRLTADDPRLHLAEDQEARIAGDDVELPIPRPVVPLDDLEPARLQMSGSQLLAPSTKPSPWVVRHGATLRAQT